MLSLLLLSFAAPTADAATLSTGAVVSWDSTLMSGVEVLATPGKRVDLSGRFTMGPASQAEIDTINDIMAATGGDPLTNGWWESEMRFGAHYRLIDATAADNGIFLNLGGELKGRVFPGRTATLEAAGIYSDIETLFWVKPEVELGMGLSVPFVTSLQISQSLGFSNPTWATGNVFDQGQSDVPTIDDLEAAYEVDLKRSSFVNPAIEAETDITASVAMLWLSLRLRVWAPSHRAVDLARQATTGESLDPQELNFSPEFAIGARF